MRSFTERFFLLALPFLRHDEQIDFAIRTGIFDFATVLHFDGARDEYDLGDEFPENRILLLPDLCAVGCEKTPHDDDCTFIHSNQAIETINLDDKLAKENEIINSIGNPDYVILELKHLFIPTIYPVLIELYRIHRP